MNINSTYDIINGNGGFVNNPVLIVADDFATAWATAIVELKKYSWDAWNFVVTINNPNLKNEDAIKKLTAFAKKHSLVEPDKVQHTIFPSRIYKKTGIGNKSRLYRHYNKFYHLTRKMPHHGWGTYFKRMISYKVYDGTEYDQLGNIIEHIKSRAANYGCAHFMVIPQIGTDSNRIMGAPCLNYLSIQVEKIGEQRTINLLAVYRNHDYRTRTFGNYWGLCDLLKYICTETESNVGSMTCISSHAFVSNDKTELCEIANNILGV